MYLRQQPLKVMLILELLFTIMYVNNINFLVLYGFLLLNAEVHNLHYKHFLQLIVSN